MTYKEAMEYIKDSEKYGSVLGLTSISELLRRLGNPQDNLKFVHIAGTNGKGSTAAYISTILAEAGYRVGRYISPTIRSYRERIQISRKESNEILNEKRLIDRNGNTCDITTSYISEIAVAKYVSKIKITCEEMQEEGFTHPTTFEIETVMSFLCFLEEHCDIVVLETGLGGRLDATNVIETTICAVITSISMDHMQYLGNTIEEIATEKAGIIKEHIPVVSYDQIQKVKKVLEDTCKAKNCKFIFTEFQQITNVNHSYEGITFTYQSTSKTLYSDIVVRLLGENQIKNAVLAIETAEQLRQLGYNISTKTIQKGLLYTRWQGRFDLIKKEPMVVVDGAHNPDASISLRKSLEAYFSNKDKIYIIGVFADKDYESIIRNTVDLAKLVITIEPNSKRALPSKELTQVVRKYHNNVIDGKEINTALKIAQKSANKEDVIIAFGSLSFLGDIYQYYEL